MARVRIPIEERFDSKVAKDSGGCWIWRGARNRDGYGSFWSGDYIGGDSQRGPVMVLAHRWAYEFYVGGVPDDVYVLHSCDTPFCVNPGHLFLGTQGENVADCERKGRRNQYRKLSAELHAEIRRRYAEGDVSQPELARLFGVTKGTIGTIVRSDPHHRVLTSVECGRRSRRFATRGKNGP